VHLAHGADLSKLEDWRRAPEGSKEDIWAEHYEKTMALLQMSFKSLQEGGRIRQGSWSEQEGIAF